MRAAIVFPNQLFSKHPAVKNAQTVFLVEEPRFFSEFRFHQTKLVFHRASMRRWADHVAKRLPVEYIDHQPADALWENICQRLYRLKCHTVCAIEPADSVLEQRIALAAEQVGAAVEWFDNPAFICRRRDCRQILGGLEHYSMTSFYILLRKRFDILLEDRKPLGGRWTYDTFNRRRLPKQIDIPEPIPLKPDIYWRRAEDSVRQQFSDHPAGTESFVYPTSAKQARAWLDDFLAQRLRRFGPYEDAIDKEHPILFHSVLSPLLNAGLILPMDVIQRAVKHGQENKLPLESIEGFVRQILGWREFIRALYVLDENRLKNANFWKHTRPLPKAFYAGTSGIEPVDTVVRRVIQNAYCHHIERLMVLGAFMLLCRISPKEVYRWFMEMFIDAYDWVMTPNVFGMSQFAAGGLMTTKPYLCGSNYILKMSNFAKGRWADIWDALFWDYLDTFQEQIRPFVRLNVLLRRLEQMSAAQRQSYRRLAAEYLANLK